MIIKDYTTFNADEIRELYTQVGWTAYTDDMPALKRGYENSLSVLGAYKGDRLLGIIRIVGDGCTVVLIQDILVFPDSQRRGIGTALIKEVLKRYSRVRQIQLTTDDTPQTVAFYKSIGFKSFADIGCCGFMKV